MKVTFSKLIDIASDYFAHRKGLLPLVGIIMITLNLIVVSIFPSDWFIVRTNILMHFGQIVALFGLMLAWAL